MPDHSYFETLIMQIADLLCGPYRPPQYERAMLPMTVLRRFDCVLAPTKAKVLAEYERRRSGKLNDDALDRLLNRAAGQRFHNHSALDWNDVSARIQKLLRKRGSKWKAAEHKLFQSVFTVTDPEAEPVSAGKNKGFESDSSLRDTENIPLKLDVDAYFETEVKPYVADAWIDRSKDRVGYEINFNRYFYVYTPPRPLDEIDADLKRAEDEILRLLQEVTT